MPKAIDTLAEIEIEKLIRKLNPAIPSFDRGPKQARNYLIFLLMLDAGLRVGEVRRLVKSDLLYQSDSVMSICIRADIAKNNTSREIPVSVRLSEAIKLCNQYYWIPFNVTNDQPAFHGQQKGQFITVRAIQIFIQLLSANVIGRQVTPHTLRHTFATRLMRRCSIRIVQALLGHKSLTSTQIYTHPNGDDLRNAINSI